MKHCKQPKYTKPLYETCNYSYKHSRPIETNNHLINDNKTKLKNNGKSDVSDIEPKIVFDKKCYFTDD